ncbi:flavin reductase family protein [Erwinia sp. BNK-24-b]|uniref:flavin reductase family protein n=1 Tax=unclassified Erwinia TaxID=2622719 RepID=UPI0039BF6ED3
MVSTVQALPSIARNAFINAMESCVTGVAIAASDGPGGQAGCTVTTFASLCAERRLLVIVLPSDQPFGSVVQANGCFCVNVLAEGQKALASLFTKTSPTSEAFTHGSWQSSAEGNPLLAGAVASLDCLLVERLTLYGCVLLTGEVTTVYRHHGTPLARQARQFVLIQRDQH